MNDVPMVAIVIAVTMILAFAGVLVFVKRHGTVPPRDYRAFFILGIVWLPLGIATDIYAFTGIGAVFMILGLANRDKWQDGKKL